MTAQKRLSSTEVRHDDPRSNDQESRLLRALEFGTNGGPIMQQKDTGIVPVTEDAFSRKLVGVVTDRDLCLAVLVRGRDPSHVWVQECVTREPVTCHLDEEVGAALRRMREHQIRRIPVVDEAGKLKGIVSLADLVRQWVISPDELFDTLEKICEPALETRVEYATRHAA